MLADSLGLIEGPYSTYALPSTLRSRGVGAAGGVPAAATHGTILTLATEQLFRESFAKMSLIPIAYDDGTLPDSEHRRTLCVPIITHEL